MATNDPETNTFAELTPGEITAIRRLVIASADGHNEGVMPRAHVARVFREVGFTASTLLLQALADEYVEEGNELIDVNAVLAMAADYKKLLRMHLRNSPEALTPEEFKQATGHNLLVPDSMLRTLWSFLVLLCGLVHWTIVLQRDADEGFRRALQPAYIVLDCLFTVVYAVDMLLWFRTLKFVQEGVVDDAVSVRNLHIRSVWFWFDVLSTAPLDVIACVAGGSAASAAFSHLRLLRFPRSIAFFTRSYQFGLTPRRVVVFFMSLPMWFLIYTLAGLVTVFALIHCRVANSVPDRNVRYLQSVYYVVQTFTTVGYGDPTLVPRSESELYFGVFLVYFGLVTNAVGIGRLVTQLQRDNAYGTREDKLRETLAVLKYFRIPHDLQTEILSFQEHVLWNDTANAYFGATSMLPQSMRDTMLLQTRVDVLSHVPYFKDAAQPILMQLATHLISACFKPEEYISFAGDPHAGVRFVLFGFIVRFDSKGRYECVKKPGDYFGFEGVLSRADEVYSHKALSYSEIWVIQPSRLHEVLERFPRFLERFKDVVPLDEADRKLLRSGTLNSMPGADELGTAPEPQTLLKSLRHLRFRLEQAVSRRALKR